MNPLDPLKNMKKTWKKPGETWENCMKMNENPRKRLVSTRKRHLRPPRGQRRPLQQLAHPHAARLAGAPLAAVQRGHRGASCLKDFKGI